MSCSAAAGGGSSGRSADMKAALDELRRAREKLRPRPSSEELADSRRALLEIDNQLISDLEQLMLTPRPLQLEAAQFASLQALRESRLRKAAELAQRGPLGVLELEEQHRHYDHLVMMAERALFYPHQSTPADASIPEIVTAEFVAEPEWQDKHPAPLTASQLSPPPEDVSPPTSLPAQQTNGAPEEGKVAPQAAALVLAVAGPQGAEAGMHSLEEQRAEGRAPPAVPAAGLPAAALPPPPVHEVPEEKLARLLAQAAAAASPRLDLSTAFDHELDFFPDTLADLPHLTELVLAENRLTELPDSVGRLPRLARLEAQFNRLAELPPTLGGLAALTHLDLRNNRLEELPPELGRCARLRYLNVAHNRLPALPEAIGGLGALETLVASLNHLHGLPASIGGCTALTTLDVHFNEIRDVPAALGHCTRLRELDLGSNFAELRSLPASLGQLRALRTLTLSQNSLRALPASLGHLTQLHTLALDGNPLRYPPKDVVAQGKDAVIAFLAEQWAAGEAEAAAAQGRGPLQRWLSKLRRKPKDLTRGDSVDDLKRLA